MKPVALVALLIAAALSFSACSPDSVNAQEAAGKASPATVAAPVVRNVAVTQTYPAQVEAIERVELRPQVSGYLDAEVRQSSLPAGAVAVANTHQSVARDRSRIATAGVDAGWEIDLFGRIRNLNRGSEAELGAAEALLARTRVVVAAEVVRAYSSCAQPKSASPSSNATAPIRPRS